MPIIPSFWSNRGAIDVLNDVDWIGIDFAFTMMNPLAMHHSKVIPELYRNLGRESEGPERLARWYRLRDSFGAPTDPLHQKVRLMKEYNRDRLHAEVFENDPAVIRMYAEMEARERKPPEHLRAALGYIRSKGKELAVVSEVSGVEGTMTISASLKANDLAEFFSDLISPAGRFAPDGRLIDQSPFQGSFKKDGSLYERLASYLDSRGIHAGKRAMVGDDPKMDIGFAKNNGFVTVQYTGLIDRGRSPEADFYLARWSDLPDLL